jgi:hypothetical protein
VEKVNTSERLSTSCLCGSAGINSCQHPKTP